MGLRKSMVATDMVCKMTRVVGSLTSLWPMTLFRQYIIQEKEQPFDYVCVG